MRSLLTIVLIIALSSLSGQGPEIEWQKSYGGSDVDIATSIQQTSDGGYIVAGWSYSNDGDVSGNHGEDDYWIVKLDADGDLIWQKSLGGTSADVAWSIQQTSDGGYVVVGGTLSNDGDVIGNHGYYDVWVVRFDTDGDLIWQKSLGGTAYDNALSIQQTSDGGYVFAGSTFSNDGDVSGNNGNTDFWVVKLDSDGDLIWQNCLGGTMPDEAASIQQTSDGGYVLAGTVLSNDGDVSGNHGGFDFWVVKLDTDGDLIWQKSLGGTDFDIATSIQQTYDGGYIVAGWSYSNDGDVSGNHGEDDYWIVKLDADGNLIWQKSLGGTSADAAWSIQQTSDGGYVIAGISDSNDGDVSGNHGEDDYWVVKLDADGNLMWQKCLGGTSSDSAWSTQQTSDEGYVVAGRSESNDGDVSGNHGEDDYWVVKLSPVVGINEIHETTFSIHPNPVYDKFTLSILHEAIGQSYFIVDQVGKVLLEGKITSASMDLDISSFSKGMYYLSVDNGQSSIEIVKQ